MIIKRNKFIVFAIALLLPVILLCGCAEKNSEMPAMTTAVFVNDFSDVLNAEQEQTIITLCDSLKQKTNAQLVVATVNDVGDKTPQEYAELLAKKWRLENDVLVLFSKQEREICINAGKNFKKILPKEKLERINELCVIPHASSDDFSAALISVCNTIANEIYIDRDIEVNEEYAPIAVLPSDETEPQNGDNVLFWWVILVIIVAVYILIFGKRGLFVFSNDSKGHFGSSLLQRLKNKD